MKRPKGAACFAALAAIALLAAPVAAEPRHGLSLYGELKYPPNFKHFDYANPDAPKGGMVKYAAMGTFDTLNPFQLKGTKAEGLDYLFDTLMSPAEDEPSSEYGLVAESADIAPDKASVTYTLRPEARFNDGSKVTPEDVVWTFDTLKTKGHPSYRLYYADVLKAEKVGEHAVRFTFRNGDNRELPSIVGELPVLSKAYWADRDFEKTTLDPPLGSGPYKIQFVEPGRAIAYERTTDYWAKDLPVNRGRFNFDTIRFDYYRDPSIAIEAFKAGEFDIRVENVSKNWATAYDSPALDAGLFKKEQIPNKLPQGMQGFGFNTRPGHPFEDPRVREALTYLFDFEWTNKNLFYSAYTRTRSYFSNSDFAASGTPSADELKLLEPWKGQIPDRVFGPAYEPPKTDGSGNIRDNLRIALKLLSEAGWVLKDGKLVNAKTGDPFSFEFLVDQPQADFERVILPFGQNLKRVGIDMSVRLVDPAQFEKRVKTFDFDMIVVAIGESLSPGNELRNKWSSQSADEEGGSNLLGIKSKAVDAMVDQIVSAPNREALVTRVHALDRILTWGQYVVPNWHITYFRVASWDKFGRPKISPAYALDTDTWWYDPDRAQAVEEQKPQVQQK